MADVSSSTFQEGIPLARRPFNAVLTKLSRGKLAPLALRAQRRSGAAGGVPPNAPPPRGRRQKKGPHLHPPQSEVESSRIVPPLSPPAGPPPRPGSGGA